MRRTDPSLTFAPLRVRSFRFQWPADLLTSWAFEMETLILGWYVMVDTGSVLLLTTFGSLQQLGTLAAPMFGVLGDRLGGRAMLCGMRACFALLAAILMILSLADLLTPAFVLVAAGLGGILRPNDQVMRNALIGDTIPRDHLMGAVGMSRTTLDSARVAGALAGATLMATLGIGRAYVFVTTFYLASLALTFGVSRGRPVPDPSAGALPSRGAAMSLPRPSSWREMLDGLLYVWTRPKMLATMLLAFLVNLTAYPACGSLLPYVARNIYETDANGLGWLVAGFSFGALLGSIGMVVTGGPRHPERSMIVYTAIWYALLLAFGYVTTMTAGIAVLIVTGIAQSIAMISMAASLLRAADDRFRGRVMGVRSLAVYGLPLGLMAAGALVERIGFPGTITVYSVIGLTLTGLIGAKWRASVWAHESLRQAPRWR
jgi:predicted MFS family arabinose efflux permease